MKNVATINDLNFGYQKNSTLFSNLNLSISAGHIYGLIGKKGEGKTTLLKLLCGLLFPDSGNVNVLEYAPQQRHPKMLANTFFLPEEGIKTSLSIKTFIKAYTPFYPKFSIGKFEGNLSDFSISIDTKDISTLSDSQRKKVMIAFAFATNSKLILLDEPFSGLDIISKNQLQRIVDGSLTDNNCIVISSQQANDLESLINSIIILNNHQVAFQQSTTNISEVLDFTFNETKGESNEIVYEQEVSGGFQKIAPNRTNKKSKIHLESLFEAVISDSATINKLFETTEL